ncbi:uncharacterized protein PFL1_06044 [Pseudozyma flocculosa PF-1]|uniref:Uncharacterized protein n=2 Tax=Pseudozyma flocculosa TaxID=84751 RepID=A0A5C3F6W6_9BASI|nr:uncharacterized protein PFL1_06044 [Pseudozyma flocculosa PF-1]EPQ26396.1 hypothetical protein PFL1_06044 [Pseudozyma flocculosa PF-1]SPO39011.1 uncharacterized protein PSFLO_04490 [Pseudozyma flocculosa]
MHSLFLSGSVDVNDGSSSTSHNIDAHITNLLSLDGRLDPARYTKPLLDSEVRAIFTYDTEYVSDFLRFARISSAPPPSVSSSSQDQTGTAPKYPTTEVYATFTLEDDGNGWAIHFEHTAEHPLPIVISELCIPGSKAQCRPLVEADRTVGIRFVDIAHGGGASCPVLQFGKHEVHLQAVVEALLTLMMDTIARETPGGLVDLNGASLVHSSSAQKAHKSETKGRTDNGGLERARSDTLLMPKGCNGWGDALAILEFKHRAARRDPRLDSVKRRKTTSSSGAASSSSSSSYAAGEDAVTMSEGGDQEIGRFDDANRRRKSHAQGVGDLAQVATYMLAVMSSRPGLFSTYSICINRTHMSVYYFDPDQLHLIDHSRLDGDGLALIKVAMLLLGLCAEHVSRYSSVRRAVAVTPEKTLYVQLPDEDSTPDRGYDVIKLQEPAEMLFWRRGALTHRLTQVMKGEIELEGRGAQTAVIKVSFLVDDDRFTEGRALRLLNAPPESGSKEDNEEFKVRQTGYPQLVTHGTLHFSMKESGLHSFENPFNADSKRGHPGPSAPHSHDLSVDQRNLLFTHTTAAGRRPTMVVTEHREAVDLPRVKRPWLLAAIIADAILTLHTVGRRRNVAHGDISSGNIQFVPPDPSAKWVPTSQLVAERVPGVGLEPSFFHPTHPPIALLIDLCEAWIDGKQGQGTQSERKAFSGTEAFWSLKMYENRRIHRETLQGRELNAVSDEVEAADLRAELAQLQPLDVNDDIESCLLVLCYELANRFKLSHAGKGSFAVAVPLTQYWSSLPADERVYSFGGPRGRQFFISTHFRAPTHHGSSSSEAETRSRQLTLAREALVRCFDLCGNGGKAVEKAAPELVRILRQLSMALYTAASSAEQVPSQREVAESAHGGTGS